MESGDEPGYRFCTGGVARMEVVVNEGLATKQYELYDDQERYYGRCSAYTFFSGGSQDFGLSIEFHDARGRLLARAEGHALASRLPLWLDLHDGIGHRMGRCKLERTSLSFWMGQRIVAHAFRKGERLDGWTTRWDFAVVPNPSDIDLRVVQLLSAYLADLLDNERH